MTGTYPKRPDLNTPRDLSFDVVVAGAGPAGLGAALAAGRRGARTLLIERVGHVGGIFTGAGVTSWCESWGGPIWDEYLARVQALGGLEWQFNPARQAPPGRPKMDSEIGQAVAVEMLLEAGVTVLYLTQTDGVVMEDNRVVGVKVVNKSGRSTVWAKVVIDATADADLAASAGAPFEWGDPQDGRLQHCNFRVWYEGIDAEAYLKNKPSDEQLLSWIKQAHSRGEITPPMKLFQPAAQTFPFNTRINKIQFSAWEFEKVDPSDALETSTLLAQCQVAALQLVRFARKHMPGHEKITIRKMPSFLGVRESRRIVGRATLTEQDVLEGRKPEDGIACSWFYMDLHDSPPGVPFPHTDEHIWHSRPRRGDWYEVPFGCLVPKGPKGILVAGRGISVDRQAFGSSRVMSTCMATGTAAGTAAALAVARGLDPDQVSGAEVKGLVLKGFVPPVTVNQA